MTFSNGTPRMTRFATGCSRDWGYCLDDEPSEHEFEFPVLPPGVMYDVDHQCRLQYGPEARYCEGIDVSAAHRPSVVCPHAIHVVVREDWPAVMLMSRIAVDSLVASAVQCSAMFRVDTVTAEALIAQKALGLEK